MNEKEVFVDTSAWIALAILNDKNHDNARTVYPQLLKKHQRLITTNLIIAETYIILRKYSGAHAAIGFLDRVEKSQWIEKFYSDYGLEEQAYAILKKFQDQDFSFTDAVSFSLMQQRGVKKAFAYDIHFQTAGFQLVK